MKSFAKDTLFALFLIPYLFCMLLMFIAAAAVFLPVIFIVELFE